MTDRAYCRISLDTKVSGSIAKQKAQISAAVTAKGGDPDRIEWYVDESRSGAIPLKDRPGGAELWGDVTKGDVVWVSKLDRAARSVSDLLATVKHIEDAGASVVFIGNDFDTSRPTGRLLLVILAAVAEFERALIAERRRDSIVAARAEGRHIVGGAPFGFVSERRDGARGLVIRPDDRPSEELDGMSPAQALRLAIERVRSGEPQDKVRHMLGLSKTGMHKILRNPRLAGMIPDGDGVVMVDGVPRIDADAALLTLVEWSALQEYLSRPTTKAWSKARGYGAALRCEVCGQRMYYSKDPRKEEYSTYVCRRVNHEPGEKSPTVTAIRADEFLEKTFLEGFADEHEVEEVVTEDPSARTEAIALAQVQLSAARAAQDAAQGREERQRAAEAVEAAFAALDVAEEMPTERATITRQTGRTYGEVWATADDDERSYLLQWCLGPATVKRGRASIGERIVWG